MNTQRKVVITTTYNEMGIIIDTKAEEVAQPDTTTHDSIPAETGKNDGVETSGGCISRQAAIDALKELTANGTNKGMVFGEDAVHRIEMLPSVQPEIIRCGACKHWREDHTCGEHSLVSPMMAYEFCSRAERRQDEHIG